MRVFFRPLDTGSIEVPPLSPLPQPITALSAPQRVAVLLLLLSYIGFSAAHIFTTPVAPDTQTNYINAPDEAAHLVYVRAIAEGRRPPVRDDPAFRTYQWHQPPLYYLLASAAYPAGPLAVRGLTAGFGLLSLLVIFQAARRAFSKSPGAAVLALGFAALLPMRHAVASSVGNDSLTELLFGAALFVMIRSLFLGFTIPRAITLGGCLGAALLTKASAILLIPATAAALVLFRRSGETRESLARGAAFMTAAAILIAIPWYVRNYRLYGELTPMRAFVREFEGTVRAEDFLRGGGFTANLWTGRPEPAAQMSRADYLGLVANWTWRTFWAAYTPPGAAAAAGQPRFLPPQFYLLSALLALAAAAGLIRLWRRRALDLEPGQRQVMALCLLVFALVLLGFTGFIWTFFQAQGRYLYPAMLPISLLFAAGITGAAPDRWRAPACAGVLGVMLLLAAAFYFAGVQPAYEPRPPASGRAVLQ